LIALRAYLDSSGKLEGDYMTLAAIAANDQMWEEFETIWAQIMDGYTPKGKYVHMREIYRLEKAFDKNLGWDHTTAFGLANQCLVYMSNLDKSRLRMFYCSVDLRAWRKLREETYQMPDPVWRCAISFALKLSWGGISTITLMLSTFTTTRLNTSLTAMSISKSLSKISGILKKTLPSKQGNGMCGA
jgi:hypothetical protein